MASPSVCVTRATNLLERGKLAASTSTSALVDPVELELSARTPLGASDANVPLDHQETQMLLARERLKRLNVLLPSHVHEESSALKASVCANEVSKGRATVSAETWMSAPSVKSLPVEQMLSVRTFRAVLTVNVPPVSMGIRL